MNTRTQKRLLQLIKGNTRFYSTQKTGESFLGEYHQCSTVPTQSPFAIILSCADSRVPPEIIFDEKPGALFVIRTAGHIADPCQIASIALAVEAFNIELIVVLGHSACGAASLALQNNQHPEIKSSPALQPIIQKMSPLATDVCQQYPNETAEILVSHIVKRNINHTIAIIKKELTYMNNINHLLVGAEYSLTTGKVQFITDPINNA